MEDNHNGRQTQWKTFSLEDKLIGRQSQKKRNEIKMTSMEDDLNGR